MDCIIVHYSEIGLKGDNRPYFERSLARNIELRTGLKVINEYGRLVTDYDKNKLRILSRIPGIAYFSPAIKSSLDIKDFIKKSESIDIKEPFKVSARRSNKNFKYTSPEINEKIGSYFYKKGLSVNVNKPRTELFIEVCNKNAYIYTRKIKGLGGLPTGVTGRVVSLISGGIDSPVASYEMIKRGCEVILVHFFNQREGLKDKILALAGVLASYQGKIKVYLVPFLNAQKEVIAKVPAKYRMIIYRRLMFMIGNKVIKSEGAKGFVTGDNVAQVASQTLDNLKVIWNASDENVYAPLISMDKEGIIVKAKKIRTYETSIKPYSDCCSYLIAPHPETRADLAEIKRMESSIDIKSLITNCFNEADKIIIS